ncbi:gp20 [Erwinia phage vB_EamM-Y2]|uniref:Gp20 n=1 Tax=Erwinia phage vB_EamM-Y2 TaxID=1051676 RepID=G0YPW9_9CAUD|nr:gp20 [Erwinia phage vB_EamM-Y2]AEJ81396.1 gp20 [Erwinia phage vB_EamM-Y2]
MRKIILVLGFVALSAGAVDFPRSEQEAFALQHSPEYQTMPASQRADVEGAFGKSSYVAHNDPTGEPVNARNPSKELPVINQRPADKADRPVITGVGNTPANTSETKLPDSTGVVQTDVRVRNEVTNNASVETRGAELRISDARNDSSSVAVDNVSRRVATNSAGIESNHRAIESNRRQIETNRRDIRRVGATAVASANLHYDASNSGYAVSVGEYRGETAIAGGLQYGITEQSAATVQVSYDGTGTGASVGFHSSF